MYNMYNNYDNYDEDNIDLEQEMYLRDIAEEEEEIEELEESDDNTSSDSDNENESDLNSDDSSSSDKKTRKPRGRNIKITEKYLEKQLSLNVETYRDDLKFLYDNEVYVGKVVNKLREGVYVFDVKLDNVNEPKKLKMIKFNKIHKIK